MKKSKTISFRLTEETYNILQVLMTLLGAKSLSAVIKFAITFTFEFFAGKQPKFKPIFGYVGKKHGDISRTIADIYNASGCTTFVDLFCGSLGALQYLPETANIIINDLNNDLINLYRVLQSNFMNFCERIISLPHSRTTWEIFLKALSEKDLNDFERAVAFYYVQFYSYRGNVKGRNLKMSYSSATPKISSYQVIWNVYALYKKLQSVTIENKDYSDILKKIRGKSGVFVYADPPYIDTSKMYGNSLFHKEMIALLKQSGCFYAISEKVGRMARKLYRSNNHVYKTFKIRNGEDEQLVTNVLKMKALSKDWKPYT